MRDPLMEKLFGLPAFEVTGFKQNDNDMGLYVQTKLRPSVCFACGCYRPAYASSPSAPGLSMPLTGTFSSDKNCISYYIIPYLLIFVNIEKPYFLYF